jgi:hypothetical protein
MSATAVLPVMMYAYIVALLVKASQMVVRIYWVQLFMLDPTVRSYQLS